MFCPECRFCCTLSICTSKDGTFYKFTHNTAEKYVDKEVNAEINAALGFSTDHRMYKKSDYRCLKPKEKVPSKDWPHYEMEGYRMANSVAELEKVKEIPFDKNFLNWEDPKVFKAYTNSKEYAKKLWKKTYGFDFVGIMPALGKASNSISCQKHCLKEEFGNYAKKCRKEGGFFKCCVLKLQISIFEQIRWGLKKRQLIENGPKASDIKCEKSMKDGNCHFCVVTHVCAKKVDINVCILSVWINLGWIYVGPPLDPCRSK